MRTLARAVSFISCMEAVKVRPDRPTGKCGRGGSPVFGRNKICDPKKCHEPNFCLPLAQWLLISASEFCPVQTFESSHAHTESASFTAQKAPHHGQIQTGIHLARWLHA